MSSYCFAGLLPIRLLTFDAIEVDTAPFPALRLRVESLPHWTKCEYDIRRPSWTWEHPNRHSCSPWDLPAAVVVHLILLGPVLVAPCEWNGVSFADC